MLLGKESNCQEMRPVVCIGDSFQDKESSTNFQLFTSETVEI